VVNASITGDTTSSGLGRLPRALRVHEPVAVIIQLGGNDGLRGYPVERMQANLAGMIQLAQDAGAGVLLVGVSIPPNYGQDYRREFRAVYESLADEYGVPLVSFAIEDVATQPGMLQDDGIHPTATAQSMMLDLVWSGMSCLLEPEAAAVSAR
jgi:acyl-CoA thioesterase-1